MGLVELIDLSVLRKTIVREHSHLLGIMQREIEE